jgi:IclR family acetate operon transcriptional repressor
MIDSDAVLITDDIKLKEDVLADSLLKPPRDGRSLTRVRAVSRAIAILRCFSPDQPFLTLGEIAKKAELDAGTTRRLLITLRDEGLIWQKYHKGLYCLSYRMLELTQSIPGRITLQDLIGASLLQLSKDSGMTVYLSIAGESEAICLARYLSEHAIDIRWWSEGRGMPFHCGAGPKILLAHFDEEQRQNYYASELVPMTPKSIVDPVRLKHEVKIIRKAGYAIGMDDVALGLSALGMPLCNENGDVLAAVSIAGLSPSFKDDERRRLHAILKQAIDHMAEHVCKIKTPISPGEINF